MISLWEKFKVTSLFLSNSALGFSFLKKRFFFKLTFLDVAFWTCQRNTIKDHASLSQLNVMVEDPDFLK